MSFPALVAGVIKCGERTWIPKSFLDRSVDIKLFWNALEVEMGLMYDLLYTKTVINHTKAGWILRGISFTCTVTVSVGLFIWLIFMREDHQEKLDMVDLAITVILLVGALALEIYAVIVLYLSFDWTMLWMVKADHSSRATKLRRRFPFLFRKKRESASLENDNIDPSSWENNREISKTLSRYLMYLLFMCPSLLPLVTSKETTVCDYTPDIGDAKDQARVRKMNIFNS
ncbi:hypothetical protein RHMOL_Rhmol05G0273300 [Rhododendron molle]|uniref:Uncharacterized protein n=1 Tax=Rhododendron molle TaxID=49168 RepID=A0ACC0NV60_RHOML|nr:hypothetical protein RHMOL_Rhmol05G0273300 [Rhododendron molle]